MRRQLLANTRGRRHLQTLRIGGFPGIPLAQPEWRSAPVLPAPRL
jgi:hypothetical protein